MSQQDAAPQLTLRPSEDGDRQFLCDVYGSTRAEELAAVPWTDEQKRAFIEQQFHAQDVDYRGRHPQGQFLVIELDGKPIGRLYRSVLEGELRVMDIALLPEFRDRGIGSTLIRDLMAEAAERGLSMTLHVERWNPARRLYDRLGFRVAGEGDVYLLLEWVPPAR